METLVSNYKKLLQLNQSSFHRYLYEQVNWQARLLGIVGARGVGKTTMMLQYIREKLDINRSLYVNAEDLFFSTHRLVDLADEFCKMGGQYLFVDEVHRYDGWARELKLIYDYHPDLHVVFSGSSILDISKGVSSDLSRRAVVYTMYGLSFREYLALFEGIESRVYTLNEVLDHRVEMPSDFRPLMYFRRYLERGYYPFAIEDNYMDKLRSVVSKTLETDIPEYANMNVSTGRKLKHLMMVVAESVPFKPNMVTLSAVLGVSRNNVADYLLYMEQAGLITQLRDQTGGIRSLGKVNKVYVENTNLIYALTAQSNVEIGNVRETFFMNQMRVVADPVTSLMADFMVDGYTFEVGGRNKTQKQINGVPKAFVVKDDIEFGSLNILPLWQFGLLY